MSPRDPRPGRANPQPERPDPGPPDQRRRARIVIVVHMAVVCALYALALAVGGGPAGRVFPPDEPYPAGMRMPGRDAAGSVPGPGTVSVRATDSAHGARASAAAGMAAPAWARRSEIAAPWEGR